MTSTRHRRSTTTASREAAVRHRTGRKRKETKKRDRGHQPPATHAVRVSCPEECRIMASHVSSGAGSVSSRRGQRSTEEQHKGGSGGGEKQRKEWRRNSAQVHAHLGPENDRPRRLRVYTLRVVAGGTSAARAQAQTRKHHTHTEARAQGRTQHTQKHAHARYLSRRTHRLETFGTPLVC